MAHAAQAAATSVRDVALGTLYARMGSGTIVYITLALRLAEQPCVTVIRGYGDGLEQGTVDVHAVTPVLFVCDGPNAGRVVGIDGVAHDVDDIVHDSTLATVLLAAVAALDDGGSVAEDTPIARETILQFARAAC